MPTSRVGIVALGMVGGALYRYFEKHRKLVPGVTLFGYDPAKGYSDLETFNREVETAFVCVPTPFNVHPSEGAPGFDASYVRSALGSLTGSKTVVIKSTVLPGTTEALQAEFPRHRLLFNPEFLTEESADQDMNYPDRQLVGYTDASYTVATDVMHLLPMAPFERVMRAREAEMVKYFGNTWFSAKVVFANQMYDLCRAMDIQYDIVKESAAADKRIGRSHLEIFHKGFRGYGGKCLPKDTRALIELGKAKGVDLALLKAVEEINEGLVAQAPCQVEGYKHLVKEAPVAEPEPEKQAA
jgi:UDPglucose 6-dehydrogenase